MEPDLCDSVRLVGREIEPARREVLLARLGGDEEFRREFVAEIRMLGMLKVVQSPEPRWLRLEDELGWSAAEPARWRRRSRIASWAGLDDMPRSHRPAAATRMGDRRRRSSCDRGGRRSSISGQRDAAPSRVAEVRPYPRVDTATGLAMVVKLDGVAWEPTGEPHPAEGDMLAAGRLRFGSGRVMLSMLTGVVLDVEGPADLELLDSGRVSAAAAGSGPESRRGRRFPGAGAELGRGRPGDRVRPERQGRRQDPRQGVPG